LSDSHAFNRAGRLKLQDLWSDEQKSRNRSPKWAISSPDSLHLHGPRLFVLLASVSIKTNRNFRRITHNLKLSERAMRGSEAQSGHLPGSTPRNRRAALKEQATVHDALVLRIPARAWMAVTRKYNAARFLCHLAIRDGLRISIFGAWSRVRMRPTHNCRRAPAPAVCPRPKMSLAWRRSQGNR
jgi:hypothetical protein